MKLTDLDGVGPKTEEKLNNVGITDVLQLTTHSIPEISEITGMDLASTTLLFKKALDGLRAQAIIKPRFTSGIDMKNQRKDVDFISTGTKALDKLFGNGIEVDATTEIYGEFGCGKTQFCHNLCVMVQKQKSEGGLSDGEKIAKVMYMDSEGTFRPERIEVIARYQGLDPDEVLKNIIHARMVNSADQMLILQEAESMIIPNNIKLIIIDSSTGLFRSDYIGRGRLSDRQGQLNHFVTLAKNLAERYHCAVVLTNQVMKDPGMMFGDPTKPIGGDIFAHSSTYRVYFKKAGKNRIARIVDSPSHNSEVEVTFALSDRGVTDPEVKEQDDKDAKKAATKAKRKATLDEDTNLE